MQCTAEQSLDVPVPEMVKQLVEVPETVSQERIRQRTVEQIVDAPVPQAVEEQAEVFRVFSQDRIQQRAVEQTIENPANSLAEMIVEVPVIHMPEEDAIQVANTHVQHVVDTVEVEKPKIVKETGQKPIIQEKINQVTKHVEVPQLQCLSTVADMPVVVQRQVFMVQKAMEVPQVQFPNKVDEMPVGMQRQIPMVPTVQKTMETPQSQCIDEMIDVPVVSVVQVPRACVVKKTVENPQFQTVEKSAEDPQTQTIQGTQTSESSGNASFHQAAQAAPRVQKIVEMPKVQSSDGEVDMPVVTQRQVPMIPNVQKTVEVPQIQYVDKIVDAPVVAWTEDVSVGTQTVSRKRKLPLETESADGTSDSEHGLVQGRECRLEVDETRERHAAGEDPDLLPVAPNMEAGGSHLQATAEEERIVDWTQDLREIRRMVEFLVRRERKLDVKADVAVRRLARLEKEHSQLEDEEREASLPDALADRTKVVKLVVDKWFVDKGFGFGRVPTGEVIFIHASVVRGAEVLMIGTDAWVQVVRDDARAQGRYRACKAWGHAAWKEERDKERASKVAEQVRRAAALTAELAAQSEKEVSEVCSHPPGLHDEATAVTPQPTCSPSLVTSNSLQTSQGFLSFSGKFRERQPRSDTRAQEKAALVDETLSLLAKVTGKDEASMRPKFEGMKLEDLRRERDRWRKRAEEKQRLQGKKEEAWELFKRQPRFGAARREEFEREYKQKVTTKMRSPFDLGPPDADEKSLQEWVDKLLVKALAEDRKKEATECQKMRQEDVNSQWRQTWEKLREINFAVQLTDQ